MYDATGVKIRQALHALRSHRAGDMSRQAIPARLVDHRTNTRTKRFGDETAVRSVWALDLEFVKKAQNKRMSGMGCTEVKQDLALRCLSGRIGPEKFGRGEAVLMLILGEPDG